MASGNTCVSIGAAFENLEVESDREKVKKKRDAAFYVKDKQGRRRFHGAFTGGFSAGYYNTVGTEEGWAPSQFVSSRAEKANPNSRKPEDFMDEEDLEEFGIAPRQVATKDEFLLSEKKAPKRPQVSLLEDSLSSMIVPSRSTIGAQLLHKMGWKEGQGIGPRVPKRVDNDKDGAVPTDHKVYGCVAHPQALDKYEEMMQKFLFAPDNVGEWIFTPKGDLHGLGYSGIDTATADGSVSEDRTLTLYGMSGQAFGVGALEEEDDDIYEVEKKQDYDRSVTDDGGGAGGQFGWTGPHSMGDRWTMECFTKANKTAKPAKKYRCPPLPRDYRPFHKFTSSSTEGSSVASGDKKQPLNAARRGRILGEEVSVFNLITPEDRQRIERAKQQGAEKRRGNSTGDHEKKASRWDQTPQYTAAAAAVKLPEWTKPGYRPFADDPAKQARYEDFLSGKQDTCSGPQYLGMTEWEKQRERTEFAKAADVYQPLATTLESKFTRGETAVEDEKKQEDERITRQTLEWHPHKILCRRFDVPEPYPHSTLVGLAVPTRKSRGFMDKATKLNFVSATQPVVEQPLPVGYSTAPSSDVHSVKEQEIENDKATDEAAAMGDEATEKVPAEERPPIDLFKSIFTESSASELSEEEEDSEEENKPPKNTVTTTAKEASTAMVKEHSIMQHKQSTEKSQHSTTEARESLRVTAEPKLTWMGAPQVTKPSELVTASTTNRLQHKPSTTVAAITSSQYGPSIPPSITGKAGSSDSSDDDDAVLPDKKRHKKRHKKHTKQHKHHHKRKHKHS